MKVITEQTQIPEVATHGVRMRRWIGILFAVAMYTAILVFIFNSGY